MLASQDSLDAIGVSSGSEFPITRQFIQGSGIQREPHRARRTRLTKCGTHIEINLGYNDALATFRVSKSTLRLSAMIRPSMPSFLKMVANSERRVATSLMAPSR